MCTVDRDLEVVDRISACRARAGAKRSAFLPQFCDVGKSASERGDQKFQQPEKESCGSFRLERLNKLAQREISKQRLRSIEVRRHLSGGRHVLPEQECCL